jgi:hypothetical protein
MSPKRKSAGKKATATRKHRAAGRTAAATRKRRAAGRKAAATRAQKKQPAARGPGNPANPARAIGNGAII